MMTLVPNLLTLAYTQTVKFQSRLSQKKNKNDASSPYELFEISRRSRCAEIKIHRKLNIFTVVGTRKHN